MMIEPFLTFCGLFDLQIENIDKSYLTFIAQNYIIAIEE